MKEQFRKKQFNKTFTITLSNKEKWTANPLEILTLADEIIEAYMDINIKMTLRQLYYQMVTDNHIPNDDIAYKKLSDLITDGRYLGIIHWDGIEDRGRPISKPLEFEDLSELMDVAFRSYRLPRWEGQNYYIELFSEKDAISSILSPVAKKWHIPYSFNKGYASVTTMYSLFSRIEKAIIEDKNIAIFYLGDHDPSGLDMVRDIEERLGEFFDNRPELFELASFLDKVEIVSVALTIEQIKEYGPPPNPTKLTDPRAKDYIKRYGKTCWEVDALKPDIMMGIVEDSIKKYIDIDKYEMWIEKEKEDKRLLRKLIKGM